MQKFAQKPEPGIIRRDRMKTATPENEGSENVERFFARLDYVRTGRKLTREERNARLLRAGRMLEKSMVDKSPAGNYHPSRQARQVEDTKMLSHWKLQDAKNRFSEVVELALREGPQTVTRRGKPAVVVVSTSDYQKMKSSRKGGLVEFFQNSPLRNSALKITRDKSPDREVEL